MYEHVPIYHLIDIEPTPSCTLCALTSHHRVRCRSGLKQLAKHHSQVTNTPCKAPKKPSRALQLYLSVLSSWMIGVRDRIWHVLTEPAWVRGVGIGFLLQACCKWCYVIQPVHHILHAGPPTGPGGRPPGLFATHAQWAGGRPFRFSARAERAGVVLRYMPGRAGGRWIFRPGARGRRPVF